MNAEQPKLDAPRLVFIDETAVTTKMVRHYGRSFREERLVAGVPHGHWKMLVAALRSDGLTAPYVIDGAMDGPSFLAYVEQVLMPTLYEGDIVFRDNLRTHKIMRHDFSIGLCRSPARRDPGSPSLATSPPSR
jgi:transposase